MKGVCGSEISRASTSCKVDDADDEFVALLGDEVDYETIDVNHIERSVNEEVEGFQKESLKKDHTHEAMLAEFWRDRGRKHSTHLSYIAQQVDRSPGLFCVD